MKLFVDSYDDPCGVIPDRVFYLVAGVLLLIVLAAAFSSQCAKNEKERQHREIIDAMEETQ